jgi:hypothetical protein
MKLRCKPTDGIWQKVKFVPETGADYAVFLERLRTIGDFIAPIKQDAQEVLLAKSASRKWRNDAENVLWYCQQMEAHLNETRGAGPTQLAAELNMALIFAVHVGRFYEVMCVRPCEEKVIHSTRSRRGAKKAGATKKGIKEARYCEIRKQVTARMQANPRGSLTDARNWVAAHWLGASGEPAILSFDTVKRATAGLKPRKKNSK